MLEHFQSYEHYKKWINENWERYYWKDLAIIQSGLMVERKTNCNGEAYRSLTKAEFYEKSNESFISIPF